MGQLSQSILFIEDAGLWLSVRAGELALRQRDGIYHAISPKIKTVVAAGHGFAVMSAAIRHCIAFNIELFVSDETASFVGLFAGLSLTNNSRSALALRKAQFQTILNASASAAIARALVAAKIKAEAHSPLQTRSYLTSLHSAKTADAIRHIEAQSAQVFWRRYQGFQMPFDSSAAPADWHVFTSRYIRRPQGRLGELPPQFTPRNAVHPIQACHNFAIALATVRLTRVILAFGFDPAFGFLHNARKPGRQSFIWDTIEPLRPAIVRATFDYIGSHTFTRKDFIILVHKITREKTTRLAPQLAKEIVSLVAKTIPIQTCVKTAKWIAKQM